MGEKRGQYQRRTPIELQKKRGPKGPSKWTDEKIEKAADDLLEWYEANPSHWFLTQFAVEYKYLKDSFDGWAEKNEKFRLALKMAKQIQELRIVQLGLASKVNPVMAIFTLKNVAGWRDRKDLEYVGDTHNHLTIVNLKNTPDQDLVNLLLGRENRKLGQAEPRSAL